MTPQQLIDWRNRLGLTAKAAAAQLGLSINGYAAYERGWTYSKTGDPTCVNGHDLCYLGADSNCQYCEWRSPRPIPKHVELACERLEQLKENVS